MHQRSRHGKESKRVSKQEKATQGAYALPKLRETETRSGKGFRTKCFGVRCVIASLLIVYLPRACVRWQVRCVLRQKKDNEQLPREERNWLRGLDLNQRPSGYEPDELPGCSTPRFHYGDSDDEINLKMSFREKFHEFKMAPAVGFEPTTNRLTADRSTTELRWITDPQHRALILPTSAFTASCFANRRARPIANWQVAASPIFRLKNLRSIQNLPSPNSTLERRRNGGGHRMCREQLG